MQINRSNDQHYDARKQSLIQQVLSYKKRILEYQSLQKQLKTISNVINREQTNLETKQSTILIKTSSRKSLQGQKKLKEDLNTEIKRERMERRISSSKKIKVYQLQKKLYRLNKDHNQKFSEFIAEKRQHQVMEQTIQQLTELISKENDQSICLEVQNETLSQSLTLKDSELLKAKKILQQVKQKQQSYSFEKKSFLDKISMQNKEITSMKQQIQLVKSQILFDQPDCHLPQKDSDLKEPVQNSLAKKNDQTTSKDRASKQRKVIHHEQNKPESDLSYSLDI